MNATELSKLLADNASSVAQHLFPQGKKVGGEWCVGSIGGEAGKSLKIRLSGAKRGVWADFSAGESGDLLDAWVKARALSVAEAMREAKQFLGVHDMMPARQMPTFKRPGKVTRTAPKSVLGEWLSSRGLTDATIEAFRVGQIERNGALYAVFPYLREGELINAKYRNIADKKDMRQEAGAEPCLYGWHLIDPKKRVIAITEGECFPGDAQILTKGGWVRLDEYRGGEVAQWHAAGSISWAFPIARVQKPFRGELIRRESRGYVSVTTPGHNIVSINSKGAVYKCTAEEGPVSKMDHIPRVGRLDGVGIALSDDQIRLALALSADASIDVRKMAYGNGPSRNVAMSSRYARFGFKKERKIERLLSILSRLGLDHSCNEIANGYTSICFGIPDEMPGKELPWSWIADATAVQRELILSELVHWDGNSVPNRNQSEYSSKLLENAEWVQALAHTTGRVSSIIRRRNEFGEWFKVSVLHGKSDTSWQPLVDRAERIPYDSDVYCLQVPSGMLVVRQEEKITISGNCDAMSLHQVGIPALSVNAGAGNHQWIDNDWARLERFSEIYLCYDNDEAGQKGVKEVANRLGLDRCKVVTFPAKDANEYLLAGAKQADFQKCFAEAKTFDPEELKPLSDFWSEVKSMFYPANEDSSAPLLTFCGVGQPWFEFREGELTVWTGYNGHGKSLLLNQVLIGLMTQGEKVCVFSGEMKPARQGKRMAKQLGGLDRPSLKYLDAMGEWLRDRMWIFDMLGTASIDRLLTVFSYGFKRYGIRHFVIDSLMMTDVPEDGPGAMSAQKEAMRKLATFARGLNVHVHLVAHPRKGQDEKRSPGKMDVAGSSKLTDAADNVFSVWSAQKEDGDPQVDEPDAFLTLWKARNGETQHRTLALFFNKPCMQFSTNDARKPHIYVPYSETIGEAS